MHKRNAPFGKPAAEETDLSKYQAAYTKENLRVTALVHEAMDLISPTRKHTFTPDIDPSSLIDDGVVFRALAGINRATSDFQPMGEEEEELVQNNPKSPTRQGQDN